MTPHRYELSDFEWSIIQPLLPTKPRARAVRAADDLLQSLCWLGQAGSLEPHLRDRLEGIRRSTGNRRVLDPGASPWQQRQKGAPTPRQPRLGTTLEPSAWDVRAAA